MNIRRHKPRSVPRLNMASMPDLIFTVLFFFMTITHMRSETPRIEVTTPEGKHLTKPSSKRSIVNLYVGQTADGQTRIQVGGSMVSVEQVGAALLREQRKLQGGSEGMVVNIRADRHTPMGLINDIKQQLRQSGLLNIRYNATETKNEK